MPTRLTVELVRAFVHDACQACADCNAVLRLTEPAVAEVRLLIARRRNLIPRRDKLRTEDGRTYRYHVHGAGYTFHEQPSGKDICFDVFARGGWAITFGAWKVWQYVASAGVPRPSDPSAAYAELDELDLESHGFGRVTDGPVNSYAVPASE